MHDRLKKARIGAGYPTATDAIRRFGWKGSTYRAHENSQNQYDAETAKSYGRAYDVSPGWLLTGEGDMRPKSSTGVGDATYAPDPTGDGFHVPFRGKAAAGIWSEVFLPVVDDKSHARNPLPTDPRFPRGAQFDLAVEGSSLNKFAQEGDYIRCVDASLPNVEIHDGDLVVIERIRQPSLREISARRLRRNGQTFEYWLESEDPCWQSPLIVMEDARDTGEEVRIIGKVLWKYRTP